MQDFAKAIKIDGTDLTSDNVLEAVDATHRFRLKGGSLTATGASGDFYIRDGAAGDEIYTVPLALDVTHNFDLGQYGIGSKTDAADLVAQFSGGAVSGVLYIDLDTI